MRPPLPDKGAPSMRKLSRIAAAAVMAGGVAAMSAAPAHALTGNEILGHYAGTGVVERVNQAGGRAAATVESIRSEEHTSELQSRFDLVCRLLLEKKNKGIED